jgi:hypothetical protein
MKKEKVYKSLYFLVYMIMFLLSYILFYNQVYNNYPSDLGSHIGFIDQVVSGNNRIAHSMFHYCVYYFSSLFSSSYEAVAIIVNTLLIILLAKITFIIIKSHSKINSYLILLLMILVVYSGTLFLPNIGIRYQYIGNGSISIWHNITTTLVLPFAFSSFFLFFYALDKRKIIASRILAYSFILSLLSIWAKPSYIVVFLPMVFLFILYAKFNKEKIKIEYKLIIIYFIALCIFSVTLLLYQYSMVYNDKVDSSKIIIAPFKVWEHYSNNIVVSIFIANAFVIFYSILAWKHISIRSLFSLIMMIGAIVVFALFAESGSRMYHGNFGWSYIISMKIAYLSFLIDMVNNFDKIKYALKVIFIGAIVLHLASGFFYFYKVFLGNSYL